MRTYSAASFSTPPSVTVSQKSAQNYYKFFTYKTFLHFLVIFSLSQGLLSVSEWYSDGIKTLTDKWALSMSVFYFFLVFINYHQFTNKFYSHLLDLLWTIDTEEVLKSILRKVNSFLVLTIEIRQKKCGYLKKSTFYAKWTVYLDPDCISGNGRNLISFLYGRL